jgi:hypothetical protein
MISGNYTGRRSWADGSLQWSARILIICQPRQFPGFDRLGVSLGWKHQPKRASNSSFWNPGNDEFFQMPDMYQQIKLWASSSSRTEMMNLQCWDSIDLAMVLNNQTYNSVLAAHVRPTCFEEQRGSSKANIVAVAPRMRYGDDTDSPILSIT